ncbi:MAG: PfaB family protein [Colwellia sp.]|nr:PfaB family protein [Colwellia sp.]
MDKTTTLNKLAVIGLDALFGAELNIDRVERAFYQGKPTKQHHLTKPQDLTELCTASLNRLAKANQVAAEELNVIIISQQVCQLDNTFRDSFSSLAVVTNLYNALVKASTIIDDDQTKMVALLGVNLLAESINDNTAQATISYDQSFGEYQEIEGLAGVLLSSAQHANKHSCYVYSWIKSVDGCEFANKELSSTDISNIISNAIEKADVSAEKITLLEVSALADHQDSLAELEAIFSSYANNSEDSLKLHTAISCTRSVTGEGYGFSQVAGLLKTVISLQQQYIPGLNDWKSPFEDKLDNWLSSVFYFPTEARPWYPNSKGDVHTAAFSCMSDDSYCHVVLQEERSENIARDVRSNGYMACSDLSLILLTFNEQPELLSKLDALTEVVQEIIAGDSSITVNYIAHDCYETFKSTKESVYRLSLIAETAEDLMKEITLAKVGVVNTFKERTLNEQNLNKQKEWKTPKGSFFTATPVTLKDKLKDKLKGDLKNANKNGTNNKVAFFYPGIGATYVGLGRDLFHLFPEIYQPIAALADDIGATLKDTKLNPRSISALDFKQLKQLDSDLRNNLADIGECGVAFACVFTKIFENVFKIYADYSAGYSMGEVSMYAALGCWVNPGQMSARLANSETFNNRLSGDLTTLRTLWDLKLDAPFDDQPKEKQQKKNAHDGKIWETYSIRATLDEVTAAAKDEDRVYCTIINTPDNLLIGGYPEACERVIKNLGVRSMAMDMPNAIHSSPAHADYTDMVTLFTMDVTERIKTKMFSSSCYLPIPHRTKAIANSIAKCLCDQVDFPRLVNSLHDKGARVFIEMGPGRSLCSWTDKILKHHEPKQNEPKSHVSVPVNAKGTSDELTYIRALAKLISHGVEADLDTIYNGSIVVDKAN